MDPLEQMKQARTEKAAKDELNRLFHIRALELLKSPQAEYIQRRSQERIKLWEDGGLCSKYYIDKWREALDDLSVFERDVLALDDNGVALRQNSALSWFRREID